MKNNVSWAKALGAGCWAIVFLLLAFIITVVAAVGIEGWDWDMLTEVFENLWKVFTAITVCAFISIIFLYKYPLQILSFIMGSVAVLLIAAAYKGPYITASIRNYIDSKFDITYIATGVILTAILFAFIAIYRTRVTVEKVKVAEEETPVEEATGAEFVEEEAPEIETYPLEIPEAKAPPVKAPEPETPKEVAPKVETPKQEAPRAEPVKEVPEVKAPQEEVPKPEAPKEEAPRVETPPEAAPEPETPTYRGLTKEYNDLKLMDD